MVPLEASPAEFPPAKDDNIVEKVNQKKNCIKR